MLGGGGINIPFLQSTEAEEQPANSLYDVSPKLDAIFHRLTNIERLLSNKETFGMLVES